jgi:hypothetical protein
MVFATATCSPVGSPVDRSNGNDGNVCVAVRTGCVVVLIEFCSVILTIGEIRDIMDITPTISYKRL